MALKHYKPMTPGTRGLTQVDRSELHRGAPEKALTVGLKSKGGRNNFGHVTVMHQGGGHKRKYRLIDFDRKKTGVPATVIRLEYDPNRTAFIALIEYKDGVRSYILAPRDLKAGDVVISGTREDIKPGNAMPLKNMPIGTIVHNVELKPGAGGQLARSAGCYAQLMGKDGVYAQIKMNSGELRKVHSDCMATVGSVSNPDQRNVNSHSQQQTYCKDDYPQQTFGKEEIINSPTSIWCGGIQKNGVIDVSFSLERSVCSPICLEKDRCGE